MPLRGKDAFKARLRNRSDKLVRAIGLEAHARLIRRTPVDTGRARANWNVAIDRIDRSVDEESFDKSGQRAIQEGSTTVAGFRPGQRLFLTNSLPYVPALERGSSRQAPNGMVAVTAAEMRALVARALASIGRG